MSGEAKKVPLDVVAGVIERGGRILLARRFPGGPHGGLWEFPGGKVEPGESAEEALRRELAEELEVEALVGAPLSPVLHVYPHVTVRLKPFWCELSPLAQPRPVGCSALEWVLPCEITRYPMPEADLPIVEEIVSALTGPRDASK